MNGTHTHTHIHKWTLSGSNGSDLCETCLCMWKAHVLYITVALGLWVQSSAITL